MAYSSPPLVNSNLAQKSDCKYNNTNSNQPQLLSISKQVQSLPKMRLNNDDKSSKVSPNLGIHHVLNSFTLNYLDPACLQAAIHTSLSGI